MRIRDHGLAAAAAALSLSLSPSSAGAQTQPPLLDQAEIRAPFMVACNGKPDSALLPVDPRTLVTPGVNRPGAAIQFNAWWVDLHTPPAPFLKKLPPRPKTCGEFRASAERGRHNLQTRAYFQPFSTALAYYNLYLTWGLALRPSDFDDQVIKRYGAAKAPWRNPYPLPFEDPNRTNGGSGQLPLGLVQERDANGRWTGLISTTCSACHDSNLGTPSEAAFSWGRPNDANDAGLMQADFALANLPPALLAPIPWSTGRGSTDAIGILDALPAIFDMDSLQLAPSLLEWFPTHAAGMSKAPSWRHRAFKTRQFWDGGLTSDNVRSEMAFAVANLGRDGPGRRAIFPEFEDVNNFLLSMSPPKYTKPINTALAEQGAVIFHTRDLWANGANSDIPKQPGNGSCASCHGVYSPRYASDPNYLPDPRLKGVAGVITPMATIQTDPQRVGLMQDERKRRAWNSSWWAYNELHPDWYGYDDSIINSEIRRIPRRAYDLGQAPPYSPLGPNEWLEPFGYVAPPLYGAWGHAPFFHNGSVPTLWDVLKPSDRPKVWKRLYTATGVGGKNRGYDPSLASYDFQKLGWKYSRVTCSDSIFTDPFLPCSEHMATIDVLFANVSNKVAEFNSLAYQSPPPVTDKQIRSRMIFNSHLYSNGNEGHEFTQSLTDAERWAILEYMKTL